MRAKNKKIYKKALPISVVALGVAVLGLGAAAIIPQFKTWTSALRGEATFISIQSPDEIKLEISPQDRAAGKLITASDYASIKTDSSSGYTLSYSVQGEAKTNELVNKDDNTARIASLSKVVKTEAFPVNHWGVSIDGESWSPLPAYGQKPEEVKKTTEPIKEEDRFDFSIGVKVDSSTPSGEYTNTLCLTAVTNPVVEYEYSISYDPDGGDPATLPKPWKDVSSEEGLRIQLPELDQIPIKNGYTFGGWTTVKGNQAAAYSPGSDIWLSHDRTNGLSPQITLFPVWVPNSELGFVDHNVTTMQAPEVPKICHDPNVKPGTTGRLQDIRDYKIYYVTKEADGQCWMTQNLALELSRKHTLTPKDTNIDSDWTPDTNTLPYGLLSQGELQYYKLMSYNPGDEYYVTNGQDSIDAKPDPRTDSGNAHYTSGNLYNWTAAIAKNDSSKYAEQTEVLTSICPQGWRLPKADSNNSEFLTMLQATSGILEKGTDYEYAHNDKGERVGFANVRKDPVWLVRAGGIPYTGHFKSDSRGVLGMYQMNSSAKPSLAGAPQVYQIFFNPEMMQLAAWVHASSHGVPIRCVAQ